MRLSQHKSLMRSAGTYHTIKRGACEKKRERVMVLSPTEHWVKKLLPTIKIRGPVPAYAEAQVYHYFYMPLQR
jgi:hypothetical protein